MHDRSAALLLLNSPTPTHAPDAVLRVVPQRTGVLTLQAVKLKTDDVQKLRCNYRSVSSLGIPFT